MPAQVRLMEGTILVALTGYSYLVVPCTSRSCLFEPLHMAQSAPCSVVCPAVSVAVELVLR